MIGCHPEIYTYEDFTVVKPQDCFDLHKTMTCGQVFNYYKLSDKTYCLVLGNVATLCSQSPNGTIMFTANEEEVQQIWCKYLDLYLDYDQSIQRLSLDTFANQAYNSSKGIHILRQDPLEMCISYIISQNNKIEHISKIIKNLCMKSGKQIIPSGVTSYCNTNIYTFPDRAVLQEYDIQDWRDQSTGFRAMYLYSFMRFIKNSPQLFEAFSLLDHESLVDILKSFDGIGPKVANCISLFGYHHLEAFPIDLWVERIIHQKYNGYNPALNYGDMAGIIQQYMFHYVRNSNGLL